MPTPPFHLAFPVRDLEEARRFYGGLLGCPEGRSSDHWVDFDFHGHQVVAHLAPEDTGLARANPVDGKEVPVAETTAWGCTVKYKPQQEKQR